MNITVDARMGNNTGIGVYISSLKESFNEKGFSNILFLNDDVKLFSIKEQEYLYKNTSKDSILHCPHFNVPIFSKGNVITTIHDLAFDLFPQEFPNIKAKMYYKFIINVALKKTDHIIAISNSTKKNIIDLYNINENKITVIHHGTPKLRGKYDELFKKEFFKKKNINNPYLLYVGINRPRKNLRNLIQAYYRLTNQEKLDIQLVIAGKKDNRYYNIEQDIYDLKLHNRVILTDYVTNDQLRCLYDNCLAFIFPSIYEGFGFPLLEAMLSKIPVVCSNTSSIPEIVEEAAALFNPYNIDDMCDKIYNVISNSSYSNNLIQKGLLQAEKFTWDKCVDKHIELYKSIWKGEC